jgi:hypothetical protein
LGQRSGGDAVDGNLMSDARLAGIDFKVVDAYRVPNIRVGVQLLPLMSSLCCLASFGLFHTRYPPPAFVDRANDI